MSVSHSLMGEWCVRPSLLLYCWADGRPQDCLGEGTLYMTLQNVLIWPPIVTAFATVVYCILARRLYVQFGWDECRLLNASPTVKRVSQRWGSADDRDSQALPDDGVAA